MTHQHRYMIHGLTTTEQAEAIQKRLIGQPGIIDARLTVDPPSVAYG